MSCPKVERSDIELRALLYKHISRSVCYPTAEMIESFKSPQYWSSLEDLLGELGCAEAVKEELLAAEAIRTEAEQDILAFEIEYNRLFQLAQNVACPITAGEYLPGESRQATAVAQLKGLYRSFGVKMRLVHEPDHLSVILEFMSWLYAKEARALDKEDEDNASHCRRARAILVEDYLGWLPLFRDAVKLNAELKFYPWLASLITEVVRTERVVLSSKS